MSDFSLIIGLGNPGPRYAQNRHNIGFQAVDTLAKAYSLTFSKVEHRAQSAHGRRGETRLILAKPQTWMNESGKAIGPLAHFYKIPAERILAIYDDLDLPLGTIRYRPQGSSGGHRGIQSIIQQLGTQDFARLKLGIGRPPGRMDAAAYVLQNFSNEEEPQVWDVLRLARRLAENWLDQDRDLLRHGMTWRIESPEDTSGK